MRRKKGNWIIKIIVCGAFMGMAVPIFAQEVVVTVLSTKGIVEVQFPFKGIWEQMESGMELPIGATVSASAGGSAVLLFADSVLTINPLTRVKIEDFVKTEEAVDTELNLEFGSIKADVKSLTDVNVGFVVRSTVAVASVRGTSFEFNGRQLVVEEGNVEVMAARSQRSSVVREGTGIDTDGWDAPSALAIVDDEVEIIALLEASDFVGDINGDYEIFFGDEESIDFAEDFFEDELPGTTEVTQTKITVKFE